MAVLINQVVTIISQSIHMSNHNIVHFMYMQINIQYIQLHLTKAQEKVGGNLVSE